MSTQDPADLTKAQWRRRALRAEKEVETLRRFREFDGRMARENAEVCARQAVALQEIEESLQAMREDING